MNSLSTLLQRLDPQAPLVSRHLMLIELLDWLRGDRRSPQAAVARLQMLVDALGSHPDAARRLAAIWEKLVTTVDTTTLLADFGFAPRSAFFSELGERLRYKLLPATPETADASELFMLLRPTAFDAQWLGQADEALLERLLGYLRGTGLPAADPGVGAVYSPPATAEAAPPAATAWQHALLDAITYCAGQVSATGFAPELRLRMNEPARLARPFHALPADAEAFRAAYLALPRDDARVHEALQHLRDRLDACRQAANSVYEHLEQHGISVGLVFRLRQLRERLLRIRELLDCLRSPSQAASAARFFVRLIHVGRERRSIRALIGSNSSLLAAKVTERSAETGSQYITRTPRQFAAMFRKAAAGGALMSITTCMKFVILGLGLSAFWGGFYASLNYALSFVFIHLLHWTIATKQPAMTAPAMATKLADINSEEGVESFVDEVTHLVRSQAAAVLGNVLFVAPCVMAISYLMLLSSGRALIDPIQSVHVLENLTVLGPTALFAAFTGVLLFSASIIGGWVENWFVLHRLDSALRYNPRITRVVGIARADRWAHFMRRNITGLTSNISLGFMLGLIPAFANFFGLGLDVRHVTLSTGQVAAAAASMGWSIVHLPVFWWCIVGVLITGPLNVMVSFYLAFLLALRSQNVSGLERRRIYGALRARLWRKPWSFLWPSKAVASPPPVQPPAPPSTPPTPT
ncbi:site-specific recombinase [Comamonas sp. BIGb0124]|uniref:site-specific recombinase n=1 Tax=Comamonas sp. BIGb0124 TaxID=2485130 RepID=UPI000F4ADB4E|nr:site-specific recombinase [Comamonas sp. BIGb0124]ROR16387.1 site-specific recombinase [Comamonas sp. BIGb0124]